MIGSRAIDGDCSSAGNQVLLLCYAAVMIIQFYYYNEVIEDNQA